MYDGAASLLLKVESSPHASRWQAIGTIGFQYADAVGAADGIHKVILKGSGANRAKLALMGKGVALPDPALPGQFPLTAQLVNSETSVCWEAVYQTAVVNDPRRCKAVGGR